MYGKASLIIFIETLSGPGDLFDGKEYTIYESRHWTQGENETCQFLH